MRAEWNPASDGVFYCSEASSFLSSEWGLPPVPSYAVAGGFLFFLGRLPDTAVPRTAGRAPH